MIEPPKSVSAMLKTLADAGFESYLAGGCVRDMLLGRTPHDYDIATPALPSDIKRIFVRCYDTGLRHGTLTVVFGGRSVEVTTFRSEGQYNDHRRPEAVVFEKDLSKDLARRDFTINAMALSRDGRLTDLFGGADDLKNGVIRAVGDAGTRFEEDALRMLRAFRFSAELGFGIEKNTLSAIREKAPLCRHLSAERVREELTKTLLSPRPETVSRMADLGLLLPYVERLPDLSPLAKLSKTPAVRMAGLCFRAQLQPEKLMAALRFDNSAIRLAEVAVSLAQNLPENDYTIKRALNLYGEKALRAAFAIASQPAPPALKRILDSKECYALKDLALSGNDLISLGFPAGKTVGEELERLLDHVLKHPADNTREVLMKLAKTPLS